jgi:hypothetical protein
VNAKPYDSPANLWPLLVTLTIRKLQRQAQRHQAECRDIQQELSLDDAESWQEIASSEPTSEHAAQLNSRHRNTDGSAGASGPRDSDL